MRLLNQDVAPQELGDSFDTLFNNQPGYSPQMVPSEVRKITFGDLDGRKLRAPKSPRKRCLSFHMHIAYSSAVEKGWLEVGAEEFLDYGTDGEYGMKSFLEAAAIAAEIAAEDEGQP